ncbi:MAG TPA: c-type cytochrome [Stellaceae bacterium]|nr:c-type cytochrome [Stellaceae bacterium]
MSPTSSRAVAAAVLATLVAAPLAAAWGETPEDLAERVTGTAHICSSCHGREGRSTSPTFPNLAGQQKEYLVNQLKAFRDKSRADPHARTYMFGMAAGLDDAVIDGLADFYSKQTPASPTTGDAIAIDAGRKIFENGIDARSVPACSACHGDQAQGAGAVPRLASQHPAYLVRQLSAFQTQSRANEIMHDNSKNLTPQEIDQVSAFFASLR